MVSLLVLASGCTKKQGICSRSMDPKNEECPGTFRHPGYYEKFIYVCNDNTTFCLIWYDWYER